MHVKKLGICGAGGYGKEVYDLASRINKVNSFWSDIFFVDKDPIVHKTIYQSKVINFETLTQNYDKKSTELIVAVGEPSLRKKIYKQLISHEYTLINLFDPSCIISPTAKFGKGVIISQFCTINSDVVIGNNVVVNTSVDVGHDTSIGNHTVISPFVCLGGGSVIGEHSYIGMSVCVKEKLSIGSNVIIGMGSFVFKDIPNKMIAMGNPARPLRRNEGKTVFN
jgi:sugar O-acyltransferase (sialic acid O-acetyltransferase NeuD family)